MWKLICARSTKGFSSHIGIGQPMQLWRIRKKQLSGQRTLWAATEWNQTTGVSVMVPSLLKPGTGRFRKSMEDSLCSVDSVNTLPAAEDVALALAETLYDTPNYNSSPFT